MPAGGGMTGKCQTTRLETLRSSRRRKPAATGNAWMPAGGEMTGKCQTIGLETLPFGNATLVAPAKAGSHWKRADAGRWRDDGKCQTSRLETLPSSRRRKPAFTGNARMPAGGGVTGRCQTIGLETLTAPGRGRLAGGTGLVV